MGKKTKRFLAMLMTAVLVFSSIPVYAAEPDDEGAVGEEAISEGEEIPEAGIEAEVAADWYEDYAHEFKAFPEQELYQLYIYAYTPRDKDKIPESIVVPAKTRYTDGCEYVTVVQFDYTQLEYAKENDYEASQEGFWHPGKRAIKSISFEEGCIIGTNCERMFSNMGWLQKVDFSKATAPNVESMRAMFYNCPSITGISFGENFNTANCVDTQCMFYYCRSLTSLDVSMLDTSSVKNMWSMFASCHGLTELNIGGKFSTRSAKDLSNLFSACDSLSAIDTTNINTSSATTITAMFSSCDALESIDISAFDLSNAVSSAALFSGCKSLKSIRFGNIKTSGMLTMEGMFENCTSLRSLDLRSFDFSGLNESENKCRYDNMLRGSGVVNLYLPVAAMKGLDLTQESTYGPPEVHSATTAENLAKIFYAGKEEEWTALGIKKADGVAIEYEYTGEEQEVTGPFYVTAIKLSETYLSMEAGKTAQLSVTIIPSDATNKEISWTVKDKKVAIVDNNGMVTAVGKGSTEITVTAKGAAKGTTVSAVCQIYVSGNGGGNDPDPDPAPAIPIPGSGEARDPQPVIEEGETLYLVKGQTFTLGKGWSSKDKILNVSKTGVVKAKNAGNATLVYGNNEKTIDVSITEPTITSKISSLPVGSSQEIALNCNENLPVLWYSAAPNIATVDQEGTVTGHSKGTAKVTAMINGKAYTCTVKVTEEASLKERDLYLNVKSSKTVKIKGLKKTVWAISENEAEGSEIVKISGAKIKALKTGDVQLVCEDYVLNVHVEDPFIEGSAKPYKMTVDMKAGEVSETPVTLPSVEQDVIFKSNKCAVAYIDDDGFIHARSKGSAKITAKINGKTVTITVKVKDAAK